MDRKLKERLIGLVVLLTAAVILVPMILGDRETSPTDDPDFDDADTREVRLDLREDREPDTTPEVEPEATATPEDEEEDAREEVETRVAEGREAAEEAREEIAEAQEEAAEPKADEAPESGVDTDDVEILDDGPEGTGWSAQVGSFSDRDNARNLAAGLREEGLEAFLMRHETEDRVLYRVRVGLESEREGAVQLAAEVEEKTGHEASPVPHP